MTIDIETQLRDYAEHVTSKSKPDEDLFEERVGSQVGLEDPFIRIDYDAFKPIDGPTSSKPSVRRRWLVAGAAAALVVAAVVPLVVFSGSDEPDGVTNSPTIPNVATIPNAPTTPSQTPSSLTWSRVRHNEMVFGTAGDQDMLSVTAGGPGLVAVGVDVSDYELGDWDAAVWTSPDGITWSRVPHDEAVFGGAGMSSVTAGGPGLVAVGTDGPWDDYYGGQEYNDAAVWTSPDGITWSRVPHDEAVFGGAWIESVTVGGPGLVAVGGAWSDDDGDAAVWTSPDGFTWSRVPHDEAVFGGSGYPVMLSVTAGGPGLVAVGTDGPWDDYYGGQEYNDAAVWTSVDGITWSRVPHDEAVFGGSGDPVMLSVTTGGPGLVAVGSTSRYSFDAPVWTSVDGVTWSRVPNDETVFDFWGQRHMSSVTVGGPGLVAVGQRGSSDVSVWTSPDGITWSRVPHNEKVFGGVGHQGMNSVTAGGPGLVAVGSDSPFDSDGSDAAVWVWGG